MSHLLRESCFFGPAGGNLRTLSQIPVHVKEVVRCSRVIVLFRTQKSKRRAPTSDQMPQTAFIKKTFPEQPGETGTVLASSDHLWCLRMFSLGKEAKILLSKLPAMLAKNWEKPCSELCGYVNARLSIAIARATHICICDSRSDGNNEKPSSAVGGQCRSRPLPTTVLH
jgi:hypothetical protein